MALEIVYTQDVENNLTGSCICTELCSEKRNYEIILQLFVKSILSFQSWHFGGFSSTSRRLVSLNLFGGGRNIYVIAKTILIWKNQTVQWKEMKWHCNVSETIIINQTATASLLQIWYWIWSTDRTNMASHGPAVSIFLLCIFRYSHSSSHASFHPFKGVSDSQ